MKERPIIFSAAMVNAILDERKTQTRRAVKTKHVILRASSNDEFRKASPYPLAKDTGGLYHYVMSEQGPIGLPCPYGTPGSRLWVRETWADTNGENGPMISYRAGGDRFLVDESYPVDYSRYPKCQFSMWCGDLRRGVEGHAWRTPIFMPRWASRITLEITEVRVERLQDISEDDAHAEGVSASGWSPSFANPDNSGGDESKSAADNYSELWETINGKGSWASNPFVWAITFKRVEAAEEGGYDG